MLIVVDGDQLPTSVIPGQDLRGHAVRDVTACTPHLLELNTDLVEGLCDDSNENVLHEPSQEEDHCAEVERSSPSGQRVNSTVHDEDPALLRRSLVDRKYTRGNVLKSVKADYVTGQKVHLHALHAIRTLVPRVRIGGAEGVRDGQRVDGQGAV